MQSAFYFVFFVIGSTSCALFEGTFVLGALRHRHHELKTSSLSFDILYTGCPSKIFVKNCFSFWKTTI